MPLELSKNLVCLYYSFVATELVLAPNNKCHSVRIRASVTALDRTAVERRCDPLHDVAATPPRRRRDRGAAMAHNNIDESYSIDILGIYESCPSCACPVYDIDTRQGCLAA